MSGNAWWVSAIQWSLWGVIMTAVMGWWGRDRLKPRPVSDSRYLVHPLSTLILGTVCFGFFAALAVLSNVYANDTATWWTKTIFVGFALLTVPLIWAYFTEMHEVSETRLVYTTILGRRKTIRWEDVSTFRYVTAMGRFRLEANTGEVARISVMLMGLPEFARLALTHVPPDANQSGTMEILQATANGNPPAIWG